MKISRQNFGAKNKTCECDIVSTSESSAAAVAATATATVAFGISPLIIFTRQRFIDNMPCLYVRVRVCLPTNFIFAFHSKI